MKRKAELITVAILALMMTSAGAFAQDGSLKARDENQKQPEVQRAQDDTQKQYEAQKQTEAQKQYEVQKQAEVQKQQRGVSEEVKKKQAEIEAKRKEIQEKVTELEAMNADSTREIEWIFRNYDRKGNRMSDFYRNSPIFVMPDLKDLPDVQAFDSPAFDYQFQFRGHGYGSKPGSSWNYSRQVMEATFTNEFTMSAGDEKNVSLTVSGDCAEGSMAVAIIMPDGKQLSEVLLDENGSLNWRKNFEAGEGNGWKTGKWTFRIKAKNATGNLRISMNSF